MDETIPALGVQHSGIPFFCLPARELAAAECFSQSENLSELEYGIGANVRVFRGIGTPVPFTKLYLPLWRERKRKKVRRKVSRGIDFIP